MCAVVHDLRSNQILSYRLNRHIIAVVAVFSYFGMRRWDDPERQAILDAGAALGRVNDAALISRGLGIPVLPWELDDWPLDDRLAAKTLASRWIKSI